MLGRSFLPSVWRRSDVPVKRSEEHPFYGIQKEMNRLFDDFFQDFSVSPFEEGTFLGKFSPSIDIREGDNSITVQAELPGMDEKDIEVLLSDNTLTIKGEKKEESEEKKENYHHVERSYGVFQRVVSLPSGVDSGRAEAKFSKGVLSITLPKTAEAEAKGKQIPIKAE